MTGNGSGGGGQRRCRGPGVGIDPTATTGGLQPLYMEHKHNNDSTLALLAHVDHHCLLLLLLLINCNSNIIHNKFDSCCLHDSACNSWCFTRT